MVNLVALPGAGDWLLLFLAPVVVGILWWMHPRSSLQVRRRVACVLFIGASFVSGFAWGDVAEKLVLGAVHWVLWLKSGAWTAVVIGTGAYVLGSIRKVTRAGS